MQKLLDTGKKECAEVLFAFKKEGKRKDAGRNMAETSYPSCQSRIGINQNTDRSDFRLTRIIAAVYKDGWSRTFEQKSKESYKPLETKDACGLDMAGSKENYDDINAAGLGQIKLFAAYDKIPCLSLNAFALETPDLSYFISSGPGFPIRYPWA